MTTLKEVDQFLSGKALALAGASRSRKKFGNSVLRTLAGQGYDLFLIHPEAQEIEGRKCHPSVSALPEHVDRMVLVVPPAQTEKLVKEAAAAGIRNLWLQQGSESAAALEFCAANGINVIHGECILMFAEPAGIHRLHRWIWKLIGKLPRDT